MRPTNKTLNREEWAKLILGMTLLFSLLVRIFPAIMTGFPLNDGGMFLIMIRDLRANGFLLPAYTSYNISNIPFAYPPLGFYLAALLSSIGIPDIELLRWLPILLNLASILAMFVLARALLKDPVVAALSAMIYAMVPGNFAWQIMGGGLTRSLGILFILLALYQVFMIFEAGRWKHVWLAALFCALAVLSHPEVSLATASSCALFWLFFGRTRRGSLQAGVVALGTAILTAPWWVSVLSMHGLAPFQAVFHSGAYAANPLKAFLVRQFQMDAWEGLFHVLLIIGLIWALYKKRFFLAAWMILPYLMEPRSAPAFAYFPATMMSAQGLMEALPQAWGRLMRKREAANTENEARLQASPGTWISAAAFALMLLWFIQGALYGFLLRNTSLRPPIPQETMAWIKDNTQPGSEFILMTGDKGIMTDPLQEWFPALALRNSRSTLQGLEWTLGEEFFPRLNQLAALQDCTDAQCIEGWSSDTGLTYSHVLVDKNKGTEVLLQSLRNDTRYFVPYENEAYVIFELRASTALPPAI